MYLLACQSFQGQFAQACWALTLGFAVVCVVFAGAAAAVSIVQRTGERKFSQSY